jgi:transcriptional/translational regulatory protein YebC/TACO1
MAIDKKTAVKLATEAQLAIQAVCEKYGLEMDLKSANFNATTISLKLEIVERAARQADDERRARALAQQAGINFDGIGPNGETLISYDPRAKKYPWVFQRGGELRKASAHTMANMFPLASR